MAKIKVTTTMEKAIWNGLLEQAKKQYPDKSKSQLLEYAAKKTYQDPLPIYVEQLEKKTREVEELKERIREIKKKRKK